MGKQFLSSAFYNDYSTRVVDWSPLSWVVYKRTYARPIGDRLENWWETGRRVIEAAVEMGVPYTEHQASLMYDHQFHLRAFVSGRALWQLGTPTVNRLGGASINNCYMTVCDNPRVFSFAMDMLMLGGGVGMNVQSRHVSNLPSIKTPVVVTHKAIPDSDTWIVPDSREGWVQLLAKVMDAFFIKGTGFSYSTCNLRKKGTLIKGFGGKASGPEPLIEGIAKICAVLRDAYSRNGDHRLLPIDAGDILCLIGWIVVSGNVRRSAILLLGDANDKQFLRAKRGKIESIPFYRAMANYSVAADDYDELTDDFWEGYEGSGEPYGLCNLALCRLVGRSLDLHRPDPGVNSVNPCAEVTGAAEEGSGEGDACNLAEAVLGRIRTFGEFCEILGLLYPYLKTVANLPYHWEALDRTVKRNGRLGMSVTGVYDFLNSRPHGQLRQWLDRGYRHLENLDKMQHRWPYSVKLTSLQPSGTKSLVSGSSPGCHADYAPYCIRRVRLATNDPLIKVLESAGYYIEPAMNLGKVDSNTLVADFPVAKPGKYHGGTVTALQQINLVADLQETWADNSVSSTVYFKPEELPAIRHWLKVNYKRKIKTLSFLKYSGHGFAQAPYEPISEAEFHALTAKLKPIDYNTVVPFEANVELEDMPGCEKGVCPPK